MRTVWVVLSMLCTSALSWPSDSDCVTADGSVGRCTAPAECKTLFHGFKPIMCRYSLGYGTRICCPRFSHNPYKYTVTGSIEDIYNDDRPIIFPEQSSYDFHPYTQQTTSSYKKRPFYNEDTNYNPYNSRPSYNKPHYNGRPKPGYGSESVTPSHGYQERPKPSSGFGGSSHSSFGNQKRPDRYTPKPAVWGIPEPEASWGYKPDRTTPEATWSVGNENRRPSYNSNSNKRISERKCEEYSRSVSQRIDVLPLSIHTDAVSLNVQKCDFSAVKLIVGGKASELGEFPHMAALGFNSPGTRNAMWNCGGTLISERYVMTAGHCVNTTFGNPVVVRLGEYNLARDNDGADPVDYNIEKIIVHPNYLKSLKYNDIALIRLSQPVRFNKWVRPACLPTDDAITGKPTATGWGRTDFVGKLSDILMKVSLSIIDNRQCNTFYNTNSPTGSSFSSGIVDTMICAGEVEGGRDTCLGDSGGPLTITKEENPCVHYVVGITSFGKICGAPYSPGVYTRVSKYLPWIERTVWT